MHVGSLRTGLYRWWRPYWGALEGRKDGTLQRLASARVSQVFAFGLCFASVASVVKELTLLQPKNNTTKWCSSRWTCRRAR